MVHEWRDRMSARHTLRLIAAVWDVAPLTDVTRDANSGSKPGGSDSRPPINDRELDVRLHIGGIVLDWANVVAGHTHERPTKTDTPHLARFIATTPGLETAEWWGDLEDEMRDVARLIGVGQAPQANARTVIDKCGCGGTVWDYGDKAVCHDCNTTAPIEQAKQARSLRIPVPLPQAVNSAHALGHAIRPDRARRLVDRGIIPTYGKDDKGRRLVTTADLLAKALT